MNEAVEIGQVANIETLPRNLSPSEERHLVMTAQCSCLLVASLVKCSNAARCIALTLEGGARASSILISLQLVGASLRGYATGGSMDLEKGVAVSFGLRVSNRTCFILSTSHEDGTRDKEDTK
jgi:hypothetical protein